MGVFSLDFIFESINPKTIYKNLTIFYTHIIKFYIQPEKQSSSWIGSIKNSFNDLSTLYKKKSLWNKIEDKDVQASIYEAISNVVRETKIDIDKVIYPVDYFTPIDKIVDIDYLIEFLDKYKYSDKMSYYCNKEYLLKKNK